MRCQRYCHTGVSFRRRRLLIVPQRFLRQRRCHRDRRGSPLLPPVRATVTVTKLLPLLHFTLWLAYTIPTRSQAQWRILYDTALSHTDARERLPPCVERVSKDSPRCAAPKRRFSCSCCRRFCRWFPTFWRRRLPLWWIRWVALCKRSFLRSPPPSVPMVMRLLLTSVRVAQSYISTKRFRWGWIAFRWGRRSKDDHITISTRSGGHQHRDFWLHACWCRHRTATTAAAANSAIEVAAAAPLWQRWSPRERWWQRRDKCQWSLPL